MPTPFTNVATKYEHPTPHGFQDTAQTRLLRPKSPWQGQRSNQCHTIMYTYIPFQAVG